MQFTIRQMTIKIRGLRGIKRIITIVSFLFLLPAFVSAEGDKAFNAGDMIIEHVTDAHSWHVIGNFSIPNKCSFGSIFNPLNLLAYMDYI